MGAGGVGLELLGFGLGLLVGVVVGVAVGLVDVGGVVALLPDGSGLGGSVLDALPLGFALGSAGGLLGGSEALDEVVDGADGELVGVALADEEDEVRFVGFALADDEVDDRLVGLTLAEEEADELPVGFALADVLPDALADALPEALGEFAALTRTESRMAAFGRLEQAPLTMGGPAPGRCAMAAPNTLELEARSMIPVSEASATGRARCVRTSTTSPLPTRTSTSFSDPYCPPWSSQYAYQV